MAMPAVH